MKLINSINELLFRKDLYVQSLQSIIKLQQGQIEELMRDKEFLKLQLEAKDKAAPEQIAPLDATPMNEENAEHWKPLREMPELPSQRRERLRRESIERKRKIDESEKDLKKSKDSMKQEMEA